ncbi:hypothetical protein PLANTIT3_60857 [Plantibacter sp. T3]|nr:hypothetical protein PLANTIT3_60857 [Plantibacter sp. T3]
MSGQREDRDLGSTARCGTTHHGARQVGRRLPVRGDGPVRPRLHRSPVRPPRGGAHGQPRRARRSGHRRRARARRAELPLARTDPSPSARGPAEEHLRRDRRLVDHAGLSHRFTVTASPHGPRAMTAGNTAQPDASSQSR